MPAAIPLHGMRIGLCFHLHGPASLQYEKVFWMRDKSATTLQSLNHWNSLSWQRLLRVVDCGNTVSQKSDRKLS